MTPDQAKTKRCCQVDPRSAFYIHSADGTSGSEGRSCIGPECMAWRWENYFENQSEGYCGLAGKEGAE